MDILLYTLEIDDRAPAFEVTTPFMPELWAA